MRASISLNGFLSKMLPAAHHAARHVLAVARVALDLQSILPSLLRAQLQPTLPNATIDRSGQTHEAPACFDLRSLRRLTIIDAGSNTEFVISATLSCSWYLCAHMFLVSH